MEVETVEDVYIHAPPARKKEEEKARATSKIELNRKSMGGTSLKQLVKI